jgi:hypothetical protein
MLVNRIVNLAEGGHMLKWLRRSMGGSTGSMSAALGALDEVVNPGAARANDLLKEQNERVTPVPSPGDRLFAEGKVVIAPRRSDDSGQA